MDLSFTVLLAGCVFLICCGETIGQQEQNVTDLLKDDSFLPVKERFRRLIPYMTFYLGQGYNTQNQYVTPTPQQYQTIQPVNNNLQGPPYYVPQYQQLVPVGYLVGGGYRSVPVYSRPSQTDYSQLPYTPQRPTDLTRTITQNYLTVSKQVGSQTKDQRPAQYITKLHYTNPNRHQNQRYKIPSQTKTYFQTRPRPQPNLHRHPQYQKGFRPIYSPLKGDSYVQLHSNYESNYEPTQTVKNYQSDPDVMTITKSQEIKYPVEENPESVQIPVPTTLHKQEHDYAQSVPIVPTIGQNSLLDLLGGYQLTKTLPEKLTPSNIGYSIQTLSNVLKLLEKAKSQANKGGVIPQDIEGETYDNGVSHNYSPYQTEGSTPGRAGIDYPAYSEIPETSFSCKDQRYKGFFGDPDTNCQVWHYCDLNGGQASFLCPNGTIFSQVALTCDWWFNVKCASTAQLYVLNERLYKYILPVKPSFPEDYAGPLVDEYLTLKFQELEAKKKNTTTEKTPKTPSTLQVLLNDEVNLAVK